MTARINKSEARIPSPRDLRGSKLQLGADDYVVLSYPAPTWRLPRKLTAAEREVLQAVLRGDDRESIARARGKALPTVANQIACAFRKLGVGSRAELAALLAERDG